MSGQYARIAKSSGCGRGEERGAKKRRTALGRGAGAFWAEDSVTAATTWLAEMGCLLAFFFFLALPPLTPPGPNCSRAARSRLLSPPTTCAKEGVLRAGGT